MPWQCLGQMPEWLISCWYAEWLASRAGRCHLLAPGWIGLYPLYRTHDKGTWCPNHPWKQMTLPLKSNSDRFLPLLVKEVQEPPVGDAGVWHYLAQPECLVQCSGVGEKEGWQPKVLHQLLHGLNAHMKKDSYPLPRIQEVLESLVGAGHFSCLDLKLGFWQIKMEEASKQYTAFTVGNLGFFKCDHMPFGLCNALAMFQRLMQNCLGELNLIYCLIYLDDLIIWFCRLQRNTSTGCTCCVQPT